MQVKSNFGVAFGMAAVEIVEFWATTKLVPLITTEQYDYILAWTLYSYMCLIIFKFLDLAYLVFACWDPTRNTLGVKVA